MTELPEEEEMVATSPGSSNQGFSTGSSVRSNREVDPGILTSWSINYSDIKMIMPPLGRGAFGVVYKAEYHGTFVAVKTYVGDDPFGETENDWSTEIANLATLHHVSYKKPFDD